ncbi:hypothetical protein GCM10007989_17750 [Devosia pacifica]|uniref:PRC-barrel domain-containing protein n=1 Tax=Devosia pacifica TaxID=1335967 RepID=A0A918S366_9HYPH|nr:PRC-barrel domain-containing protein [Devosia pacifica]GHA22765.1 hypothetical protein GCM10007989_17750 [Devosia pacifica]
MKRFTMIAAVVALGAAPVAAQDTMATNDEMQVGATDWSQLIRTRDITGGPVYTTNEAYDEGSWGMDGDTSWGWSGYDGVGPDWNEIGEIEDLVLDQSGQLTGIVAEVGGFLDIGDKHVYLEVGDVDLVPVDGGENYVFITRFSEEQLEERESVDEGWWQ